MRKSNEYDAFERLVKKVLAVPHSTVQAKLNAEKAAKKRRKSKKSAASREAIY